MRALVLNLTTMCNANCPFCIVHDTLNRPELNMTDDEIFDALRNARAEGAVEVGYSGGEPSLHKRIVEIIAYAKEIGFTHQSMNTNGIRFQDPEFCERLIAAGLDSPDFSIHGHTDALHDREVARKGALKAIRRACENLKALRGRYRFHLSATTVVTRHNHEHLVEIVQFLEELGFENKRLKYAYEGNLTHEQVIDEVAPYQAVVPSVVAAIEWLTTRPYGFHFTHVPLCLVGDAAAFSSDFGRRPAIMAFKRNAYEGDAGQYFRRDGDECESCVVRNLCTRLDQGYERFHGRPELKPFREWDDVDQMFDRATERYASASGIINWVRSQYTANRDAPALKTTERASGSPA